MSDRLPLYWTWAQAAAQFGGRSAQWLRRQIAENPAFVDFPQPDRRTSMFRARDVQAWCDRHTAPAQQQPQDAAGDWARELLRRLS